jgi:hypothetical protein
MSGLPHRNPGTALARSRQARLPEVVHSDDEDGVDYRQRKIREAHASYVEAAEESWQAYRQASTDAWLTYRRRLDALTANYQTTCDEIMDRR